MFQHNPDQFQSTQIITPSQAPRLRGLTGDTLLETEQGWRRVDAVTVGDRVQTFDGGLRQVVAVRRHYVTRAALKGQGVMPVRIRGGVLNACSDLLLMPGQGVLCAAQGPDQAGGQDHRLIAARDLVSRAGVSRRPVRHALSLTELGFAEEEVVWANTGLLLHCPAAGAWEADWGIYAQDLAAAQDPVPAPMAAQVAVKPVKHPALAVA